MTNAEKEGAFLVWHSGFVINSSFDICALAFHNSSSLVRRSLGEGGFLVK